MVPAFQHTKTLSKAVTFVKRLGLCHSWYCHYTTLDALLKIIETGSLRLTRSDSPMFDDTLEQKRFGDQDVQRRLFFSCFSHELAENAAMWGLYCPPTYKAVRIVFHRYDLKNVISYYRMKCNWLSEALHGYPQFSDVVYAGSFGSTVENNFRKCVCWEDVQSQDIVSFDDKKNWPQITGYVKDYEWHFEKETRLYVKTREVADRSHFDIAFPLAHMNPHTIEITMSPWADEAEMSFVRSRVKEALRRVEGEDIQCQPSGLRGGLGKWARKRGV